MLEIHKKKHTPKYHRAHLDPISKNLNFLQKYPNSVVAKLNSIFAHFWAPERNQQTCNAYAVSAVQLIILQND